jgi:putative DNA primase/helicase
MTRDLRTGQDRPHRREDYNTKITAVAADERVPIPLWSQFLDRVTAQDKELQAYLQRMAGYCMTGVTTEHVLFFLYGTGANGKGVFLNTLHGIWGSYAAVASMETFIETRYEQHSTDLAMLDGARLVIAQEVEKGKAWSEAKINRLTGGDPITARYMRQDFFTYKPKFKLIIAGNHKPSLRSVNEAVRRRFHLVPFTVTIPPAERDKGLFEKLKPEWPGIFNWALQGCLEWQKIGLAPPKVVSEASEAYFAEEDLITTWIGECCAVDEIYSASSGELYQSWKKWAEDAGEHPGSNKAFSNSLEERGYKRKHTRDGSMFYGIALTPPEMTEEEAAAPWVDGVVRYPKWSVSAIVTDVTYAPLSTVYRAFCDGCYRAIDPQRARTRAL